MPEAPSSVAATAVGSGKLTVSWQQPPGDGGSPIRGYNVQWKSGTQEYDSSRQAVVTDLTDLVQLQTINGLTNDQRHTIRVLADNDNGDGAATSTAFENVLHAPHTSNICDACLSSLPLTRLPGSVRYSQVRPRSLYQ